MSSENIGPQPSQALGVNTPQYLHRVVAQINIYPMDLRHVRHLLSHQVRVWGPMVERIIVTVDTHRSTSGRYRGSNFDVSLEQLRKLLAEMRVQHPQIDVKEVDYSPEARRAVAQALFGRDDIPVKAWDGGPFYAYFYGLHSCNARYIVHFDGDMLYGGGSTQWVEEAVALFDAHPDLLLVSPLPGPPRADGTLLGHGSDCERVPELEMGGPAYRFKHASTRIFMIDMQRLHDTIGVLPLIAPDSVKQWKARLLGNPLDALEAEVILGNLLRDNKLWRIDVLGSNGGIWSLHPPYRGETFYERLPQLISSVENGAVPDAQRGHYDMNDSMIDWTSQREAARWPQRLGRMIRDRLQAGA